MRQWLTSADDVSAYQAVSREIVHHQPAAMLSVIDGLVWPSLRVEVEVTKGIVSTPAMFSAAITHCAEATWAS